MNKEEQFEHIENKIREAAENLQPAFDEKAWDKMEILLDNDKRRRPFIWVWFFVPLFLASIGGIYFFNENKSLPNSNSKMEQVPNRNTVEKSSQPFSNTNQKSTVGNITIDSNNKSVVQTKKVDFFKREASITAPSIKNIFSNTQKNKKRMEEDNLVKVIIQPGDLGETDSKDSLPTAKALEEDVSVKQVNKSKNDTSVTHTQDKASNGKNKTSGKFYLLASAGPDIGSVKLFSFKNSSLSPKYGLGLGYAVNKKLSVQTGMYISRKKYLAEASDYHPKEGSYWYMVKLIKVDANCLVYEIPLTVRYNVITKKNTVYYTAAGLSSYIMKKEDYKYYFIRNNIPVESAYSYTGNKHFLSVFTLAAGIEKKLNNKISLLAEPSISLPLSGVGDGKVKIFSTTVQIGLKYQPFKQKK